MATLLLTQNDAPYIPNLGHLPPKELLGWKLSTANALDFVVAMNVVVGAVGYIGTARCYRDPTTPVDPATGFVVPSWHVTLEKSGYPKVECNPGQWVTFDGVTPIVLDDEDVQAKYTITTYTP